MEGGARRWIARWRTAGDSGSSTLSRPADGGPRSAGRRAWLRGVLTLAALAGLPARALAQKKAAKKMVQYQEKPKGAQECDNCLHFVAPNQCKLVEGPINPKGWCALFAPKPK